MPCRTSKCRTLSSPRYRRAEISSIACMLLVPVGWGRWTSTTCQLPPCIQPHCRGAFDVLPGSPPPGWTGNGDWKASGLTFTCVAPYRQCCAAACLAPAVASSTCGKPPEPQSGHGLFCWEIPSSSCPSTNAWLTKPAVWQMSVLHVCAALVLGSPGSPEAAAADRRFSALRHSAVAILCPAATGRSWAPRSHSVQAGCPRSL